VNTNLVRILRLAACLYFAILLQTVLAPKIAIFGVRPDLPFIVVLLVALSEGSVGGAFAGFLAGLFVGLNSAGALGVSSLANTVVGFAVGAMADRLERRGWITRALVALIATTLRDQIEILLQTRELAGSFAMFWRSSLPGGVYTAILAPMVMRATEKVAGREKESTYSYR
jgi:rod shape-determining protein MreD